MVPTSRRALGEAIAPPHARDSGWRITMAADGRCAPRAMQAVEMGWRTSFVLPLAMHLVSACLILTGRDLCARAAAAHAHAHAVALT